ncbi:MAG TPA: DUF2065 domain-containing protein [Deltaproteobacteria bacterium]|nr:DUF2065 domain-containing protein [Deltaproteobacteria bacterium]
MGYLLCVVGMVFIIEALPYIAFPGKVKEIAQAIHLVPNRILQVIGIIVAFAGLAIIYIGRHMGGM